MDLFTIPRHTIPAKEFPVSPSGTAEFSLMRGQRAPGPLQQSIFSRAVKVNWQFKKEKDFIIHHLLTQTTS